ncbi:MAG: NuoM family protein [Actinomycetota bacterium]
MPGELLAADQAGFPVLSVLVLFPALAALGVLAIKNPHLAARVAVAAAGIELAGVIALALALRAGIADMQFVERVPIGSGVSWHLGVDGMSVMFLPLIALLALMVIGYSEHTTPAHREPGDPPMAGTARGYAIAILALEATMIGAFVALDLIVFWVMFVAELVPSWFLIDRWGTGPDRRDAARSYVGYVGAASVAMLVGIVAAAAAHDGGMSFELARLVEPGLGADEQVWPFLLIMLGLAVKAPFFPFHAWLPKVLEHGPIVGMSVFLVGIKLGTYGMIRFVVPMFPDAIRALAVPLMALGAAGIVYGAILALGQTNLRRLLGFASVSHMGVVLLGIATLNLDGFEGSLLQMINLGIVGAGLFFIAGFLSARIGPPELDTLGGLVSRAPLMTAAFLVVAIAGIGLPGTNGFNGEHLVMLGGYRQGWWVAIAAGLGVFLTAAYSLWYFQRAFLGEGKEKTIERFYDLTYVERVIVATLTVLIFWIGLGTSPFIHRMRPPLAWLEDRVEQTVPGPAVGEVLP